MTTSRRPVPSDLRFSPRHAALIRESWWLVVVAAVAFLTLILATYQKTDAGWSFSGAGTPTIVPLHGRPGHFAVHAVCQESVFWETLQKLKAAGASAILVVPIEKMMLYSKKPMSAMPAAMTITAMPDADAVKALATPQYTTVHGRSWLPQATTTPV